MPNTCANIYILTAYNVGLETFEVIGHYSSHFLVAMAKERKRGIAKMKGEDIEFKIWASTVDSDKAIELT